jgi:prophage regulatory protein
MQERNALPATGFLRQRQILGDRNADPPVPPLLPISKSAWRDGIRTGKYPKPVKLGPRTTAWRVEDVVALIEGAA